MGFQASSVLRGEGRENKKYALQLQKKQKKNNNKEKNYAPYQCVGMKRVKNKNSVVVGKMSNTDKKYEHAPLLLWLDFMYNFSCDIC